jgi:hypothetical protein
MLLRAFSFGDGRGIKSLSMFRVVKAKLGRPGRHVKHGNHS